MACQALRRTVTRHGTVTEMRRSVEPVTDFAGNGTAFVLSSELLPREDVAETRRFDVPDFSPGFVVDGVISTAEPRK